MNAIEKMDRVETQEERTERIKREVNEQFKFDCYNIAVNYLKDKYGVKRIRHTGKFESKIRRCRNKKERDLLLSNATDRDFLCALNPIPKDEEYRNGTCAVPKENIDDVTIEMLIRQRKY